ncbi:hypothetical protein M3G03_10130 [Aestuariimicrobium sp. p3-SID1156]|uniref:hypothetical protein n=1 Tax=Aestuariimicrobium sp. p3-SID1156 TaxID=2916038 RepID=UPI00223A9383|nr:hypothetical protein [Aestuariimicrobium sp. p3-SID1156]MCT1459888.1 hypothetical protein [Aestuariimicrobium sp. p3-SID1156]
MTDLDLTPIKARLNAATPGPWENDGGGEVGQHWSSPKPLASIVSTEVSCMAYCYGGSAAGVIRDEDADFIAHAPTDIAALVAEVERLQELACTCPWTPESTWFVYGDAVEPGSQREHDPWCPIHHGDDVKPVSASVQITRLIEADSESAEHVRRVGCGHPDHSHPCPDREEWRGECGEALAEIVAGLERALGEPR